MQPTTNFPQRPKPIQRIINELRNLQAALGIPLIIFIVLTPCIIIILMFLIFVVADNENFLGQGSNDADNQVITAITPEATTAIITNTSKPTAAKVTAELADTNEERARGLMNRRSLGVNNGMLFVFPDTQKVEFWMKDTYISLDMIFISPENKVVSIAKGTKPLATTPTYSSNNPVKYVLEVNAGFSDKNNYSIGDTLLIDFIQG